MLSYAGDKSEIYEFSQKISHSTRAYITNARGLKGFLQEYTIAQLLVKAPQEVHQWQIINIKEVQRQMSWCETEEERLTILRKGYPRMYIYVMTYIGRLEKVKEYRNECKKLECGSMADYSYYVHGWFLVWLDEQRAAGKLRQGKLFALFEMTFSDLRLFNGVW